ncbi:hypothetical protein SUGI_0268980 [Cryptomeria japonica]|nr:hypothetical protein SUGI_0268980 [Cryptomeria japonica]
MPSFQNFPASEGRPAKLATGMVASSGGCDADGSCQLGASVQPPVFGDVSQTPLSDTYMSEVNFSCSNPVPNNAPPEAFSAGVNGPPPHSNPPSSRPKSFSEAVARSSDVSSKARKEGHLRKDCPIIRKKPAKIPNPSNPNPPIKTSNSTLAPDLVKSLSPEPTPVNPIPVSAPIVPQAQKNPSMSLTIDLNSDDGFVVVRDRKKRKSNYSSPKNSTGPQRSLAHNITTNSNNVAKNTNENSFNILQNSMILQNEAADGQNLPKAPSQKLPQKVFKEIEDDFDLEVIPAMPIPGNSSAIPSMEIEHQSELGNVAGANALTATRRGRLPGQESGEISESASPSAGLTVCSNPNSVSK